MSEELYAGDAVFFHGTSIFARSIEKYTEVPYTHGGLRIEKNFSTSLEFNGFWKGGSFILHDLNNLQEEYVRHIIRIPKGISSLQRQAIKILNEEVPKKYDVRLLLKLRKRYGAKKTPNLDDLSREGEFSCLSRMRTIYSMIGFTFCPRVHISQTAAIHYLEAEEFETDPETPKDNPNYFDKKEGGPIKKWVLERVNGIL